MIVFDTVVADCDLKKINFKKLSKQKWIVVASQKIEVQASLLVGPISLVFNQI